MPKFPDNTVWNRWKTASCRKTARFVQSFRYNTCLVTVRRTNRHTQDDSIYRAVIKRIVTWIISLLLSTFSFVVVLIATTIANTTQQGRYHWLSELRHTTLDTFRTVSVLFPFTGQIIDAADDDCTVSRTTATLMHMSILTMSQQLYGPLSATQVHSTRRTLNKFSRKPVPMSKVCILMVFTARRYPQCSSLIYTVCFKNIA